MVEATNPLSFVRLYSARNSGMVRTVWWKQSGQREPAELKFVDPFNYVNSTELNNLFTTVPP